MIDNRETFPSTTAEGGNTPPAPTSNPFETKVELHRFGDNFRLEAQSAFGQLTCVLSPTKLRQFRDRANALLKEGREVRQRGRKRR